MSEMDRADGVTEAPEQTPLIPQQREFEEQKSFATPSWMGPSRTYAETEAETTSLVPPQAEPAHDRYAESYAPPPEPAPLPLPTRDVAVLGEARWVEHVRPRIFVGTVLTLALIGVVVCLVLTVVTQSVAAIASLVGCAIVAVIFRGGLMSSGVTTVELKGATLKVRREGTQDVFNLSDPSHRVEMIGSPGDAGWRLRLESFNGQMVELTPAQVNPSELAPVITYYRALAERERFERDRRFNR